MQCDFSEQVSQLIDGDLETDVAALVREHIESCAVCQTMENDFIALSSHIKFCAFAPGAAEQRQALSSILAATDTRRKLRLKTIWKPPAAAFAAAVCVAILVAMAFLNTGRAPVKPEVSSPSWQVARIEGAPKVGANGISKAGRLQVGDWLETDNTSRAKVDVADIGHVEVDTNSRLRLVETSATEHRLALAEGKIHALIYAPPRLFFVDTPSAVAVDYGCAYTLEVDERGRSLLHVTAGWVALEAEGRESFVPAGAACATERGKAPGTPHANDVSVRFVNALAEVDFSNDAATRADALSVVLKEARRKRDALALWHLLARVEGKDRARTFDRLNQLVQTPAGVTREGILLLDSEMLERWKDEVEVAWYEDAV